ncbi:hypothetical protein DPEC_G00005240 [Dallia pectoralis]|uniref:Uncharacterized protein n=1 Tax=Dallia pectoralis TaxID=75939 RepID=A0ACC2HJU7_DALPE|nr:hypothetical protein DPEC_G00005240 [Dallia pectoralis]
MSDAGVAAMRSGAELRNALHLRMSERRKSGRAFHFPKSLPPQVRNTGGHTSRHTAGKLAHCQRRYTGVVAVSS